METFPTLPFLLLPQKRVAAILNILADLELPHSTYLVRIINTSISHNSLDLTYRRGKKRTLGFQRLWHLTDKPAYTFFLHSLTGFCKIKIIINLIFHLQLCVYDPVCETLNFCFAESAPGPMCLFTLIGIFHFISLCIIYLFIYSFIYLLFSFNSVCGFRFKFL